MALILVRAPLTLSSDGDQSESAEGCRPMRKRTDQSRKPSPAGPVSPFQPFLEDLLGKIAPSAQLLEFVSAPADHYTLRIGVQGRPPRELIINRAMIEQAETNPAAMRALRGALTARLGPVGPTNVARGYRGTRIPPDTPCTVCAQPIREWERPAVKQARIMHARCAT